MHAIERRLRILVLFNSTALCALAALAMVAFTNQDRARFTELDAERINIVEAEGQSVLFAGGGRATPR